MTLPHSASAHPPPDAPKPKISPPNSLTISALQVGCKVYVSRPSESISRKAEILSRRERKFSRAEKKAREENGGKAKEDGSEWYIHYVEFNKRLDEWIPSSRILLSREVEWPITLPPPPPPTPTTRRGSNVSTPIREMSPPAPGSIKKSLESGNLLRKATLKASAIAGVMKRKVDEMGEEEDGEEEDEDGTGQSTPELLIGSTADKVEGEEEDGDGDENMEGEGEEEEEEVMPTFSKTREIEKLRTQGSMTQSHSEVSRVKNLDKIQMGKHQVDSWYFSPYPIEFAHTPILYICEFCLSFYVSEKMIERHRKKCKLLHPPGNEIYRHEDISFFEIDGRKQKTWCRNLCLLSKCFLDHKTLYYDVDPFMYYVMAQRDSTGVHVIGYFSKEKESADNYNVACILTLPQYQRMGYGKLLIEFSYELSKTEGKLGSPEKPLSDLGLLSYRAYWAETIVELLLSTREETSIDELANKTAIVHSDVMSTCQVLHMLKFGKGAHHLIVSEAVIEQHERAKKKGRRKIDPSKLLWKAPQFSRNDLRFGF